MFGGSSSRAARFALVVACAGLLAGAAWPAQPPAEPVTIVEELVARAYGGPPWWKVSDRDTSVYVLAVLPLPLEATLPIDQEALERRLKGANELILPPRSRPGVPLSARGGLDRLMRETNANSKENLEPALPSEVRARFVAAREKVGRPATRYGALPPGLAGMVLAGDVQVVREKARPGLATAVRQIETIVAEAARRQKVKAAPAELLPGLDALLGEVRRPGVPCLVSMLDFIDATETVPVADYERWSRIARSWVEGDLGPFLDAIKDRTFTLPERGTPFVGFNVKGPKGELNFLAARGPCSDAMPKTGRPATNFIPAQVSAIKRALRRKGHAVAIVSADALLLKDGVLDRLRREGYTITRPDAVQ